MSCLLWFPHFGGISLRRLLNVLVLLLIVVLAGGIVLAAIPKVREAAARVQCQNNLKQIGLAMENYYGTFDSYPSAAVSNDALPCGKRLSWLVETLPFMDQIGLVLDPKKAWDAEENLVPKARCWESNSEHPLGEISLFRCPSNSAVAEPGRPGLTHYVGMAGVGEEAGDLPLGYPGVGFFGCDRRITREDIKDGTGNTMAVLETNFRNGAWTASGFPTVRSINPSGSSYLGKAGLFASGHRHITNAVFADGSVRSLADSVRSEVFESLATIAGGEETGPVGD